MKALFVICALALTGCASLDRREYPGDMGGYPDPEAVAYVDEQIGQSGPLPELRRCGPGAFNFELDRPDIESCAPEMVSRIDWDAFERHAAAAPRGLAALTTCDDNRVAVILLPYSCPNRTAASCRAVIAHEMVHVRTCQNAGKQAMPLLERLAQTIEAEFRARAAGQ